MKTAILVGSLVIANAINPKIEYNSVGGIFLCFLLSFYFMDDISEYIKKNKNK